MDTDNQALLVIDLQRGMLEFDGGWDAVLPRVASVLERARAAGLPVVYLRHGGGEGHPLERGSEGWQILDDVAPREGELIVDKRWSDAFVDTDLERQLRERGVGRLVVTGAQSDLCVDATVRSALSHGFDVTLVADAHTTFDNDSLTREQIVRHHNETLPNVAVVDRQVTVVPSDELGF